MLAAMFDATYYMLIKRYVPTIDKILLSAATFTLSGILLLLISGIKGLPVLEPGFYSAVLITGILNIVAAVLYFQAFQDTDLSLAVPMLSFTPVFLILPSFIFLGELPTFRGSIGILLIVGGGYLLNRRLGFTHWLDPFHQMRQHPGILAMLGVALIFSISIPFDKRVVIHSDAFFGSSVIFLFVGISLFLLALIQKKDIKTIVRQNGKCFLIALTLTFSVVFVNLAYLLQIVPYVISVKRLSLLGSVVYGKIIFHEANMKQRIVAVVLMIFGITLILIP